MPYLNPSFRLQVEDDINGGETHSRPHPSRVRRRLEKRNEPEYGKSWSPSRTRKQKDMHQRASEVESMIVRWIIDTR